MLPIPRRAGADRSRCSHLGCRSPAAGDERVRSCRYHRGTCSDNNARSAKAHYSGTEAASHNSYIQYVCQSPRIPSVWRAAALNGLPDELSVVGRFDKGLPIEAPSQSVRSVRREVDMNPDLLRVTTSELARAGALGGETTHDVAGFGAVVDALDRVNRVIRRQSLQLTRDQSEVPILQV
jgi:hypothetical protein